MCIFFRKKFTFLVPVKFKLFYEKFHNVTFNLLDVGCGNHAPSQAKAWFPFCKYYGIDKTRYNNCEDDFSIMEKFYCIDLVIDDLCNIPDNFFDVIILSHVIEHLPNGLDVVKKLTEKLVAGGCIYIEFPSVRSLNLPSVKNGILNFYDDPSHVKVYEVGEITDILIARDCRILKAGVRRDKAGIILLPFILLIKRLKGENLTGLGLWDLFGFAEFIFAEKKG